MIRNFAILSALAFMAPALEAQILPDNELNLQDCLACFNANMSKEIFDEVIDGVAQVYAPIVEGQGGFLVMNKEWTNSTVNASAMQIRDKWHVNMYGGLARRPEVTVDGFALVVCHELGHHLAGFPFASTWAANEGQSDFFATHKCAPSLWKDQLTENAKSRELVPETPKRACDEIHASENEQNLCYRLALAGESLAKLLGALRGGPAPSFDTPDQSAVRRTNNNHPDAQCRLDTYMAGAVCLAGYDKDIIPGIDQGNSVKGEEASAPFHCTTSQQYTVGLRPACWFKARL